MAAAQLPEGGPTIGRPDDAKELAPMLAARAELLYEFGMNEKAGDAGEGSG